MVHRMEILQQPVHAPQGGRCWPVKKKKQKTNETSKPEESQKFKKKHTHQLRAVEPKFTPPISRQASFTAAREDWSVLGERLVRARFGAKEESMEARVREQRKAL